MTLISLISEQWDIKKIKGILAGWAAVKVHPNAALDSSSCK
jgi:hypothetical protein